MMEALRAEPRFDDDFARALGNGLARTPKEISHVAANGGTVGVFPRPNFIAPNTSGKQCNKDSDCASWDGTIGNACVDVPFSGPLPNEQMFRRRQCNVQVSAMLAERDFAIPAEVKNDCDGSSKTFAVKYLWLMRQMKGHGLTLTTDFNGLNNTSYPRFGRSIPGKPACGQIGRGMSLRDGKNWPFIMSEWQKIEHSGIWYDDYADRSPQVSSLADHWNDPDLPSPKKRWKEVIAREAGEVREDRAPRFSAFSDGTPISDRVFYNDFGPDIARHDWRDQDANRPGAQLFPMKRWRRLHNGWDFNVDGFQHIGLLPDLLQDMRNVGVQWEQMGPLFHGAQDYISTWDRSVALGNAHP